MSASIPTPPSLSTQSRALLFLLPLVAFLLNLGGAPLFDVDEGAFSEATREMFERGDFLSTWLNGSPRFDKPILIYWCQAIFVALFGPSEWAFRMPSALAGAAWCYAVGVFAGERGGRHAAMLGCVAAASSLGVHAIGRAATADALLNMLLALALFDAWRHLESGARAPLLRSFLWIALGVLTKGPVAIVVPAATTFLFCASYGRWRDWLRATFNPWGWLILVGVAAPWYLAALNIHGQDFIDGFILKHNVERFSGPLEGHSGSIFYYALIVPILLLPWSSWLFKSIGKIAGDWRDPSRRFLWIWFLFVIVFFTASGTKLPHYALYGCTPLFVLIALHRDAVRNTYLAFAPALLLLALFVALPTLVKYALAQGWIGDAFYVMQLNRIDQAAGPSYFIVAWGALLATVAFMLVSRVLLWQRMMWVAAAQILVLTLAFAPMLGEVLQGPVKRAGLSARAYPEEAVQWNFHAPSFSVYRQAVTPARQPVAGQLALTRADRLPAEANVDILFREGAVLLVRVKQ